MLIKVFGVLDLLAGLILIISTLINFPNKVFIIFGLILISKSTLGLLKDFGSWVDLLSGSIFLLLLAFSIPNPILIVFGLLLLQKAIFSFL